MEKDADAFDDLFLISGNGEGYKKKHKPVKQPKLPLVVAGKTEFSYEISQWPARSKSLLDYKMPNTAQVTAWQPLPCTPVLDQYNLPFPYFKFSGNVLYPPSNGIDCFTISWLSTFAAIQPELYLQFPFLLQIPRLSITETEAKFL